MNITSQVGQALRGVLERPERGIIGMVENLLRLCPKQGLRLYWQDGVCRVRVRNGASEETIEAPLRKSVFRAVHARIAALCNKRWLNSVSPYGGRGELSVGANPPTIFRASFANTPAEQTLELTAETAAGMGSA